LNARYELLLLRHAEAKPAALDQGDFQRPLTAGGREAAVAAAHRLSALPWCPQRLLYSPALRAQQTAALVREVLKLGASACLEVPELYLATPQALRAVLQAHHGKLQRLMIVGHNPGLSEWGAQLALSHASDSLPTAGYWLIDFAPAPWQQMVDA
jgi:phosphohistidine phosphatase